MKQKIEWIFQNKEEIKEVYLKSNINEWTENLKLTSSPDDIHAFFIEIELMKGETLFNFLINGNLKTSDRYPKKFDENNVERNYLEENGLFFYIFFVFLYLITKKFN